jgi:DNA-binding response OmpR family regulator
VSPARPRTVLVVEDNPDHALLLRIAVERTMPDVAVRVVGDGVEAISYLEGVGPYADRGASPYPDLVMLDLVMPRLDGFGVLAWLRRRDVTAGPPVVVLTSSLNPEDEVRARSLGAADFLTKPSDLTRLSEQVRALVTRWVG